MNNDIATRIARINERRHIAAVAASLEANGIHTLDDLFALFDEAFSE